MARAPEWHTRSAAMISRRRAQQPRETDQRIALRKRARIDVRLGIGAPPWPVIDRRLAHQWTDRDVGRQLAIFAQDEPPGIGNLADEREIELPFLKDSARRRLAAGAQHYQHALLAFAEHDFVGAHAG